jgi:Filamentous haemagglutinin family outer membrane protein
VTQLEAKLTHDTSLIVDNADPVRIYSLSGDILNGTVATQPIQVQGQTRIALDTLYGALFIVPNAPAQLYAGGDISNLAFYGTNFTASDITSIAAGGNISFDPPVSTSATPNIELSGPGNLIVQAGGNIDFPSQRLRNSLNSAIFPESGIRMLSNSLDSNAIPLIYVTNQGNTAKTNTLSSFGNPFLPDGGASLSVLVGVGKGIDYTAFTAAYLNPATATTTAFLNAFASAVASYETSIGNKVGSLTPNQAWVIYQGLPETRRDIIAGEVFVNILNQTGKDYNDPTSAFFHQYARGYQAINMLFPASFGYTSNSLEGGSNGANSLVATGNLDMRGSTIQTQQGGDISILAPGGRILVGSSAASPATKPASEGIITLEKGNISTFTDQDVLVAQSRIFTEQGGNILMWSSSGNLDAGRGAKTSVSFPPPVFACDLSWYCVVDVKGAVSGAGIATLQSLPDVPVGNANLIAPRGTVDAGAAGIRVTGNLNIAALFVANAFNIQVQGTTVGIPTAPAPNVGALSSAANATAATQQAALPRQGAGNSDRPSVIIVEVLGYGGGDGDTPVQDQQNDDQRRKARDQQGYNQNSAVQFVKFGETK